MEPIESPLIVRALPEAHLRKLGERWELDKFFSGKREQEYVDWAQTTADTLHSLYGYDPEPLQLRRFVAAAIVDEQRFLDYLYDERLVPKDELEDLACAAAGTVVALYLSRVDDDI